MDSTADIDSAFQRFGTVKLLSDCIAVDLTLYILTCYLGEVLYYSLGSADTDYMNTNSVDAA